MFITQLNNGNFAVMKSTQGKAVFVCECESYSAAEEMKERLEEMEMNIDEHDSIVFDDKQDAWVCATCGQYLADRVYAKELDADLPHFCCRCGASVHF